jgi:hypothetical protein
MKASARAAHDTYLLLRILATRSKEFTLVLMSGKIVDTDGGQRNKEIVPERSITILTIQSLKPVVTITILVYSTLDKVTNGSLRLNSIQKQRDHSR